MGHSAEADAAGNESQRLPSSVRDRRLAALAGGPSISRPHGERQNAEGGTRDSGSSKPQTASVVAGTGASSTSFGKGNCVRPVYGVWLHGGRCRSSRNNMCWGGEVCGLF